MPVPVKFANKSTAPVLAVPGNGKLYQDVPIGKVNVSTEEANLRAEYERLKAENKAMEAALAEKAKSRLRLQVTPKGGLSVYGLGHWPVTLYKSQWRSLLSIVKDIEAVLPQLPDKA